MANFFDNLVDMFSGNKKKEQGAEQAPTLFDSLTDAWTGFLNRVNESNKQNIQSGHYTVAEPQQQQTSPAMDYSLQPQEMSWDDLTRATVDKLTEMITGKKKQPWETDSPFGDKDVDERFAQTVIELDAADPDMKNKNILKDAYDITSRYVNDVFASDNVVPLTSTVNPFEVADREWRKALDQKIGEVSAAGKSAEELRAMLEEGHYETEKQHQEKQNQGIIEAATALRDKNDPTWRLGTEEERQARENQAAAYERLPDILENVWQNGGMAYGLSDPNDAALYQQMMNSPKGKALINRYMQGTATAEDVKHYGQTMAEAVRGSGKPKEMTLDEAESYLNEQYPMYGLAKDTQGSMDAYSAAYGDVRAIGLKAAKGEELTDTERQVWSEAVQEMPWLSDWRINLDSTGKSMDVRFGLNMQQQAELEAYGKTKAQQIADVAGMYSPYELSPKNRAIWEAYTRTPEGAAQWAEDAQGTKDAQKAKDNLWFVERQSKYDEVASRPDFAETSKVKEDFHSGNDGFDQKYNVINNIGGAGDRAGLLADIGGSSSYAVSLYNFMTPEEKGVFNSYANSGAIDAANEYLDFLSYAINERMTKEGAERMQAMSEDGVGGALVGSAVSVPLSIARGVGYLDQLGQNVAQLFTGRPVDRNSQANMIGKLADSAREGVQNQVDWDVNILGQDVDVFDFLYGTAMSGIDSFTAGQLGAALGGIASSAEKARKVASWTGAAILGGGAAQSAMQEVYDRGGNNGTALLMGAIAGANETLWERWSIGNLIEHGQDVGKKAFAEEIKNVLTEAGVNASEEFNTSVANGIAEYFLNHDDREVQKKADEYERLGLSPEAALEKARGEFWASAVMDAAGGLLMGGAFGVVENAQNRQNVNRIDRTVGKGFSPESIDTMYSLAEGEGASTKAKELARKFPKEKANAKQMGELFRELSNTMGAGIKEALHNMGVADIALRLGQETGAVDRAAADAVTAMMEGENLSGEQVAAIAANPAAMKIVDELFKPDTQAKGEAAGTGAANGEGVSGAAERISREPVQFEQMPGMEMPGKIDTSARGEAAGRAAAPKINVQTVIGQDKSAAAQRIESIDEDEGGGVRVKLEDGQSVDLEDAGLSAPMQEVARAAAGMKDQAKAAALMNAAETALKKGTEGIPSSEGESADAGETDEASARLAADVAAGRDFALGFSAVYDAAAKGQTREQVRTVYGEQLQEDVREKAFAAGRQAFERMEEQARQRNMEEAKAFGFRTVAEATSPAPGGDTYSNRGGPAGVLFDRVGDSLRDKDGNVNNGKLLALKLIDRVFKQTGMQARVVDKLENDANGKYVHGTNIVYLSMDAEEGAITKAASHEGFHFISAFSPDMKKTITDFVMDKLGKVDGYDIERRIQEVQQQYRDGAGQELGRDGAIEEIVADSMLDVIGTEENMTALMKESKSTAEKIREWITNTYRRFREILDRLAGYSPEVKALKDDVDYLGKISEMWNEGARQAAEAWQQAQAGYNDGSAALEQSQAVQQYRQEMQGDMTVENRENSLTAFLSQLFMDTQGQWIQAHMDEYEEGLAKYRQALLEYKRGGVALNVALERAGLSPLSGNDIRVASYAAEQALTLEGAKERAKARAEENAETNTGGGESYSLRSQPKGTEEENKDLQEKAVEIFGKTYNWTTTGYLLPDGTKLDFSGKRYGSNGRYREEDHREILEAYGEDSDLSGTEAMIDFMGRGAMRIMPESGGIQMQTPPTKQQLQALDAFISKMRGEVTIDIDDENGNTVFSKDYDRGTYSRTIIADIPSLFEEAGRSRSETAQFHSRYSLPSKQRQEADAAEAVRQDAELYAQMRQDADSRAALELLMRMHEQTTEGGENALIKPGAFEKRLGEMVEKIKADTATRMSDRAIRKGLRTIYQAMEKPGYSVGEILTYAKEFYQQVLEQAPGVLVEMDDSTREAVRILRTNRFQLTPDQKSEIKGTYGSLGDYMRKNFGKLKISNSAKVTLADVWRESLNPLNPGLFAEDTAEADMPGIIDAFLENAHAKKFAGEFGANLGAMSTDGALNLMLDFYDVPGAYKQKSEVRAEYQERFDQARALVNQYRVEARQAMNTARAEYQQKYRERLEKDRQSKAEREAKQGVINEIKRNVKPLKTMLVKGTDNRHIPEAMRGAIERMLNNLGMDRAIFSGQEARELYVKLGKWAADSQLHDAAEAAAYDPDILAKLEWLEEHAGKAKALRDMTMQELEAVRDAVQNMYKMVTEENEIEVNGRKRKVSDLAEAVMGQMKDKKEASSNPVLAFLRKVGFKEMTPVYYAKQVGGTLGDLINDMIRSESDVAFIIKDAKAAFDKTAEKYHLNDWIHDKKHLRFQTSAGDTIELTREQAMTLYAWAEREKRNKTQSAAHLRRGGFTYDRNDADVKKMKGVNFTKSHVLSDADVARIRNYLTDEQRGFVETMVKYLSEDMAEKGNEASMRMFGWKKFGEKWYFPYPTDRNFRGKNTTDAKGQPDKQIKYMGSSHALTENAMNPLKLDSFSNIWAEHVDEMARYSVMAEKLDNLQRVTNYVMGGLETDTGEVFAPESVKKEIERALGQEGAHYLEQLIRDANGNRMGDERGMSDKFISLFKKGSVAANMSVILQQPSAFVRAMSMVNPRYFGRGLHEHGGYKATKERMYANSGVANLKQWGGFDTNTGKGFEDTLLDGIKADGKWNRFMEGVDEWTGKGAEKADEITWVYMYSAIEAEIDDRTDYKRGTEDFNKAVARRFDEVMRATQVYDSSMAKSEWMRSTSTMDKIVTSFMAEPTLWINMMMDAALDVKNNAPGARGKAARAVGVFVAGTFVNSLLQSIATAFRRKKDEGTTIAEKYLAEFASNFTDSLSIEGIAGMIPIARDVVSLFQGYDVERADMAVIGNMIDAWRKMEQHLRKGEMPDVDEWMNLAGMAGNMFGVPVRNIYRDVSGIIMNTFGGASSPIGETSGRDILYSVLDETSWNSFLKLWDPSNAAYYDRMEQALIKGDMDKYNELRGYLEDTKRVKGDTISTGIKNELKESVLLGLVTEEKAVELMVGLLGVKDEKTAFDQIDKYVAKAKANGDEDFEYSKYAGLMDAVKSGGDVEAEIKRLEERGNARKTVVSNIKSQVKDWYLAGDMTKAQAEKALKTYVGISDSDNSALYWTLDEWDWLKANPNGTYKSYGNIFDAVDSGNAQAIKAAVQKHLDHPHTKQMATDVHRQITDHFKPIYVELMKGGKKTEAANLKAAILTAYEAAGYARDMKNKDIDKWVK